MQKSYKTIIRDLIVAHHPFHQRKYGARILCFHDIQDAVAFEKRIQWLLEQFKIVSLPTLLKGQQDQQIALTFDDAYQSWITNVLPILQRYNLPATFFVNSGLIDLEGKEMRDYFIKNCKRNPYGLQALSLTGLQQIASNPLFEIGGHTKDHMLFSEHTSTKMIEEQIILDKQQLEAWTSRNLCYFAYPFGQTIHAPLSVQKAVAAAGYKNAFSIIPGFVQPSKSPYFIPRDSLELFQAEKVWDRWLHGAYDDLVSVKNKLYASFSISYR